jgi:hypothetical protein
MVITAETTMIGGFLMTNTAKKVTLNFGDVSGLDEGVKSFYGLIYPPPKDGVKILNLHLMHGMFQLLRTKKKVWPKLKEKNFSNKVKVTEGGKISADSTQPNLQGAVDCATFVIWNIAKENEEDIDENTMKDYILALIGYSIYLVESWATVVMENDWHYTERYQVSKQIHNNLNGMKK